RGQVHPAVLAARGDPGDRPGDDDPGEQLVCLPLGEAVGEDRVVLPGHDDHPARNTVTKLAMPSPPMLCTAATLASGSCIAPALPVSCMAASTSWLTPVAPTGWPLDFSPPDGFTGRRPSR